MINRLSNPINRNRSAAKFSRVASSNAHTIPLNRFVEKAHHLDSIVLSGGGGVQRGRRPGQVPHIGTGSVLENRKTLRRKSSELKK